ncbi:MAG: ATP-binding cassette domain-containing protein [Bdellovibrionales bacterium]|nr:ATP-binding cassette domain-containing protein [Bdellovibrionales bacterium]
MLNYIDQASEIDELLQRSELITLKAGELLCNDGEESQELFILIDGRLRLFTRNEAGERIQVGSLIPGRSLNIYSVIRNIPYQYGAQADTDSNVLRIPLGIFHSTFSRVSGLFNYLRQMTENQVFKKLTKEMDELGIGQKLKVFLLGNASILPLNPQQVILNEGGETTSIFLVQDGLVSGFQKKTGSGISSVWRVQEHCWTGLAECLSGAPGAATFKSTSKSTILRLERSVLIEAKTRFPEDFEAYCNWILKLAPAPDVETIAENEGDDVDAEELFSDSRVLRTHPRWLRYPWVQQNDQMDCGPACLAMISKFWGNELSIQFWRQKLQTNQLGTTLFDLAETAEKFGFLTHPIGVEEIGDVDKGMLPSIVLRQYHYMVLYQVTTDHVILGDPNLGIRKMTLDEFKIGFEQAVLLLKPVREFLELRSPKSKYSHYLSLLRGYGREMGIILGISIMMVFLSLLPAFLLQLIFDRVIAQQDYRLLFLVLGLGIIGSVSTAVLGYARSRYIIYVSSKFDFIALSSFFRKLFSLPYDFIASRHVGDFTRRLTEMERLRDFLTNHLVAIVLDLITLAVFAACLYAFNPKIMIATMGMCSIMVFITVFFSGKLTDSYQRVFNSHAEQDSLVTDTLKGVATIKTLDCEVTSRWRLEERIATTLKARNEFFTIAGLLGVVSESINEVGRFVLVGLCAYLALRGELSTGQVISASVLVTSVLGPFNNLAHSWSGIQEAKAIARRLNDIFLAESEKKVANQDALVKDDFRGEIEFQDVWFRFGGESNNWALRGVSFKIEAGDSVALVGPSGSGKSTIGQLLGGLYSPTKGRILIDGRDIGDYDPSWLRKKMGFILQEPSLFQGSIAENIAMVSPEIDFQRVHEVASIADAADFISKKPNTINYVISHGGIGLSGGEKQRIAFARALYSDPRILVLDEATSALDGISEKAVMLALKGDRRTIINIAHRFSTATASDYVILMDIGVIAGVGPHSYLSKTNSLYQQLFNLADLSALSERRAG